MICPLYIIANCAFAQGGDINVDCADEDCAWYDGKQCAILSIMKALESIANGVKR